MTKTPQSAALLKTIAATPETEAPDEPLHEETAIKLRELCERQGESFNAELTEIQAQQRIEDLEHRG